MANIHIFYRTVLVQCRMFLFETMDFRICCCFWHYFYADSTISWCTKGPLQTVLQNSLFFPTVAYCLRSFKMMKFKMYYFYSDTFIRWQSIEPNGSMKSSSSPRLQDALFANNFSWILVPLGVCWKCVRKSSPSHIVSNTIAPVFLDQITIFHCFLTSHPPNS